MGVHEGRPASSEPVHVWRLGLGVTSACSYPIVQVINGDEEDVERLYLIRTRSSFYKVKDPAEGKNKTD